jgi:site-specific DNA-methyltransferase (adenine-specific)/modification methylase
MTYIQKVVIGDCTLYQGDCFDVLPTLERFDAVITDPPYGIFACGGGKWGRKAELQWDKQAPDISSLLTAGDDIVIWGGNYFPLPPSRGWLVWYKRDSVPSAADVELAWTNRDMNSRLIDQTIAATNAERAGHPTQKPLAVMRWTLSFFPKAQTILDPFAGSGTTGVAAVQMGRKFTGIERDPAYFAIACRRIEQAYAQGQLFTPAERAPQEQINLEAS